MTDTPTLDLFDPSAHKVPEVIAHLEAAEPAERERVILAEVNGQNRATIAAWAPSDEPEEAAPVEHRWEDGEAGEPIAWVPIDMDGNPIPGAVHDPEPRAD